jgi:hypothetical protein
MVVKKKSLLWQDLSPITPLLSKLIRNANDHLPKVGRYNSVGIATRYGLEVHGPNPGEGKILRTRPDRPWGLPSLLYNGYRVSFPGVQWPRRDVEHPQHLAPRLKKE